MDIYVELDLRQLDYERTTTMRKIYILRNKSELLSTLHQLGTDAKKDEQAANSATLVRSRIIYWRRH